MGSNLFIKCLKYDKWYNIFKESKLQSEETIAERVIKKAKEMLKIYDMSPVEGDEEVSLVSA